MAAAEGLASSHSGNPSGVDMGPLVPHPELPPSAPAPPPPPEEAVRSPATIE